LLGALGLMSSSSGGDRRGSEDHFLGRPASDEFLRIAQ
jgi:hypothetical protein